MTAISIDDYTKLELTSTRHAAGLYDAVEANRQQLAEFLPWVERIHSVQDFIAYTAASEARHKEKKEVSFVIMVNETVAGRIGLHHWDTDNNSASIGYWLTRDAQGKGIITRSCQHLIEYGFNKMGLHRIEIRAAVSNRKSRTIPEKLNFCMEGILREAEQVNGAYLDLAVYSLLNHREK